MCQNNATRICVCAFAVHVPNQQERRKIKWNGLISHKMKIEGYFPNMLCYFGHNFFYQIPNEIIQGVYGKRIRRSKTFMMSVLADSHIWLPYRSFKESVQVKNKVFCNKFWLRVFFVKFLIKARRCESIWQLGTWFIFDLD